MLHCLPCWCRPLGPGLFAYSLIRIRHKWLCCRLSVTPYSNLDTSLLVCTLWGTHTAGCGPQAYVTLLVRPGAQVQLGHLADSVSGRWSGADEVSLRHKYETPLSTAIVARRTSSGQRPQQPEPLHETQSRTAGIARCGPWLATHSRTAVLWVMRHHQPSSAVLMASQAWLGACCDARQLRVSLHGRKTAQA